MSKLPEYETVLLTRRDRLLTITMNRPEVLNAFNGIMHVEFIAALKFASSDSNSDVILLTGAGRAFSAGGDLDRMQEFIDNPDKFEREATGAKNLIFTLLDIEKPIIARVNGHAVGLGATIALFCDIIFAADTAKIGDPHVAIGLVAGDGGAVIWPQLIGFARAKEYLLTGDLIPAPEAAQMGLINHSISETELDSRVDACCDKLLNGATKAICWTKVVVNMELKRIAHSLLDAGMAYESLTIRSEDHRNAVASLTEKMAKKT